MGIANKQLQRKLLETADLNYDKAVEKCRVNEATNEQSETMNKTVNVNEIKTTNKHKAHNGAHAKHAERSHNTHGSSGKKNVQKQQQQQQRPQDKSNEKTNDKIELRICKFCNYKHVFGQQNCPAFGKECKKCSKKNHFSAVCKVKNVNSINGNDFDNNSDFFILMTSLRRTQN